ncbi:MAG: LON peptidase substrate-binding domain-containing protein, partial [Clostridia bacterium]|nr:LON peptidase substrate-binding domain-containing protein [Clostridia bacterium]
MAITVEKKQWETMPVLALRGVVALPTMMLTLDVVRKKSVQAVTYAMETQKPIYLITQKNILTENPENKDLYKVGCVCRVRQILKMPDGIIKVLLEGICRAKHTCFSDKGKFYEANIEAFETLPIKSRPNYVESLIRRIREEFFAFLQVNNLADDIAATAESCDDLDFLCDYLAYHVPAPFDDKQFILEQNNVIKRAKILIAMLDKERQISQIDKKIIEKTKQSIDDNQKEFYLKEQMRIISDELYGDDSLADIDTYYESINGLNASEDVKEKLRHETAKLAKMPQGSHDGAVLRTWLDTLIELPWGKFDKTNVDINRAEKILDRDFYGMSKVKERILEMLSVYALSPDITGQILCLAGPPGVGKTSIGKTVAECMGR